MWKGVERGRGKRGRDTKRERGCREGYRDEGPFQRNHVMALHQDIETKKKKKEKNLWMAKITWGFWGKIEKDKSVCTGP